jgi:hypothetical protein
MTNFSQATTNCNQNLTCITKLDGQMAGNFTTFSGELANIQVPAGAASAKAKVVADSNTLAQDFTQLSKATTSDQYDSIASSTGVENELNTFQSDVNALDQKLLSY